MNLCISKSAIFYSKLPERVYSEQCVGQVKRNVVLNDPYNNEGLRNDTAKYLLTEL